MINHLLSAQSLPVSTTTQRTKWDHLLSPCGQGTFPHAKGWGHLSPSLPPSAPHHDLPKCSLHSSSSEPSAGSTIRGQNQWEPKTRPLEHFYSQHLLAASDPLYPRPSQPLSSSSPRGAQSLLLQEASFGGPLSSLDPPPTTPHSRASRAVPDGQGS